VGALSDRLKDAWLRLTRSALPLIDYYTTYRAKVVAQSADLKTLDVQPDDARLPGMSGIQLKLGEAAISIQLDLSVACFVQVGFEGGSPSRPFLASFEAGAKLTKIVTPAGTVEMDFSSCNLLGDGTGAITIKGGKVQIGGNSGTNPLDLALNAQTIDPYSGSTLQAVGNTKTYIGDT
jgi:hypothetical protein